MPNNTICTDNNKGFTLLELMIVIAIAAIIAAIAVPSMQRSKIRADMMHATNQLKTTLSKIKASAFTSGRPITLCPITGASTITAAALTPGPNGQVINCAPNWIAFSDGTAYDSQTPANDIGWIAFENSTVNGQANVKEANERLIHFEVFDRNANGRVQLRKNNNVLLTLGPNGSGGPPTSFVLAYSPDADDQISAPGQSANGNEKRRTEMTISNLGVVQTIRH